MPTTSAAVDSTAPADPEPSAAARRRHLESTGNASPALPFGVTLLGPAWSDEFLWDVAAAFQARQRCPTHVLNFGTPALDPGYTRGCVMASLPCVRPSAPPPSDQGLSGASKPGVWKKRTGSAVGCVALLAILSLREQDVCR